MGRRRSASTLTMPNSDCTRFKVPFTRLTRRLLEEVTRKFWPTGPSKLPWTWHWRRLQRFKTEDKPPVVRTMYRFWAAAWFGATRVRMMTAKMMAVRFIVATTWVSPALDVRLLALVVAF